MTGLTVREDELLVWSVTKTSMQSKLGEFVQYFQVGIDCNNDLPTAYIDPTQILPCLLDAESPDDIADDVIQAATIPISMDEGIPTIEGVPFWERLEGEPIPYYKLFKEYREMKYLPNDKENNIYTRSIARLATSSGMAGRQLNALSRGYHWQMRAKAYDKYKELEKQMLRQRNIEMLEAKHAQISNELLDQAVAYLKSHPEQLQPKTAIDLVELATRTGRVSLGLYPDKPGGATESSGRGGTQVSIINQQNAPGGDLQQINMPESVVERKTKDNAADLGHLQSVLHILNQSGAFTKTEDETEDTVDMEV